MKANDVIEFMVDMSTEEVMRIKEYADKELLHRQNQGEFDESYGECS